MFEIPKFKRLGAHLLLFLQILVSNNYCWSEDWNTPQQLTSDNTQIEFTVDSTWHLVHGKVNSLNGKVWLLDPVDPFSLHADLSLDVASISTDNSSRDKKLREVMDSRNFPEIKFQLASVEGLCKPEELTKSPSCSGFGIGTVTIKGVGMPLKVPISVKVINKSYIVSGTATVFWDQFNVEDPSILVAKVDPRVDINFTLTLKPENNYE